MSVAYVFCELNRYAQCGRVVQRRTRCLRMWRLLFITFVLRRVARGEGARARAGRRGAASGGRGSQWLSKMRVMLSVSITIVYNVNITRDASGAASEEELDPEKEEVELGTRGATPKIHF